MEKKLLIDFIEDGKNFFNNAWTYPTYVSGNKDTLSDIILYDYGLREIRPYLLYLSRTIPEQITPDLETVVQEAILSYINRNDYKFRTLFATEEFDYNPIENYNMTENMTNDQTVTQYGKVSTLVKDKDSTDTRTLDLTDGRSVDLTDENTPSTTSTHTLNDVTAVETSEIEGFNSSDFVDSGRKTNVGSGNETTVMSGTDTTTHSGTDDTTHSGTDTLVRSGSDTDTDTLSGSDTATRNYELTRTGNIGVTTSQQMIESERQVANFSALSELAHGIVNAISIGVY